MSSRKLLGNGRPPSFSPPPPPPGTPPDVAQQGTTTTSGEEDPPLFLRRLTPGPPSDTEPDAKPPPPAQGLRASYVRKTEDRPRQTSSPHSFPDLPPEMFASFPSAEDVDGVRRPFSFSNLDPGRLTTAELKVEVSKLLAWLDSDHEALTEEVGMASLSGITDNIEARLDRLNNEIKHRVQRENAPLMDEYRRKLTLRLELLKSRLRSLDGKIDAAAADVHRRGEILLGQLHDRVLLSVEHISSEEALLKFAKAHQKRLAGFAKGRVAHSQYIHWLPYVAKQGYGTAATQQSGSNVLPDNLNPSSMSIDGDIRVCSNVHELVEIASSS